MGTNLGVGGWCRAQRGASGAAVIAIRLRRPRSHEFNSLEHCLQVMWHEMTHITHGNHSAAFYQLMDELRQHYELIRSKGMIVDASGFPIDGGRKADGARHNPSMPEARRRAADAAEQREKRQRIASVSGVVGGAAKPKSPNEAAAAAAARRARDAAIGLGDAEEAAVAPTPGLVKWDGSWRAVCPVCGPVCVDVRAHASVDSDDERDANYCDLTEDTSLAEDPPKRKDLLQNNRNNDTPLIDLTASDDDDDDDRTRAPSEEAEWACASCACLNPADAVACSACERVRDTTPDTTKDGEVALELERREREAERDRNLARDEQFARSLGGVVVDSEHLARVLTQPDTSRDADIAHAIAREQEAASLLRGLVPSRGGATTLAPPPPFDPFAASLNGQTNFRAGTKRKT
ncbi:hypothetical protein CTAYLR_003673 [Chrysophaeum taylorii]|uniref:Uncharacterized protein n=1 Tax=Chrysophaeum taylorii TaxID=2483200 RepID=A0AAD7UD13_9STRA|nr:hypothetical protein CTAYLR_003673 [Chrysophaeum taylorii]